jgi:hypothetical protein
LGVDTKMQNGQLRFELIINGTPAEFGAMLKGFEARHASEYPGEAGDFVVTEPNVLRADSNPVVVRIGLSHYNPPPDRDFCWITVEKLPTVKDKSLFSGHYHKEGSGHLPSALYDLYMEMARLGYFADNFEAHKVMGIIGIPQATTTNLSIEQPVTTDSDERYKWLNIAGVLDGQITTIPASALAIRRAIFSVTYENIKPELIADAEGVGRFNISIGNIKTAEFTVTEFDDDNAQIGLRIMDGIDYSRGQWDELREDRTRANAVIEFIGSVLHLAVTYHTAYKRAQMAKTGPNAERLAVEDSVVQIDKNEGAGQTAGDAWHIGRTLTYTPTSGSLLELPDGRLIQAREVPPLAPATSGATNKGENRAKTSHVKYNPQPDTLLGLLKMVEYRQRCIAQGRPIPNLIVAYDIAHISNKTAAQAITSIDSGLRKNWKDRNYSGDSFAKALLRQYPEFKEEWANRNSWEF